MDKQEIERHLNILAEGEFSQGLEAIRFFDRVFSQGISPGDECIRSLIQCLGHRIWRIRSHIFETLLKHQEKISSFVNDALLCENEDVQYWSIQIYCTVAKENHELSLKESNEEKKKKYLSILERNVKRLIQIYPQVSDANQLIVLSGLGKIGYARLIPFFSEQLNSLKWVIRNESCKALIEIGEASVNPLKKLILEGTKDQCYWAFRALGTLLGEKALDPFFRVISSRDYADEIRIYALAGMKQIKSDQIIPYLIRCLSQDLWVVRAQASETLIAFKDRVTDNLLECVGSKDPNVRYWALKTLSQVVTEADISKIEPFLKEADQELRFYCISALSRIRVVRSVQMIASCFDDESWLIRKHAADSLVSMGEVVIQPLMSMLRDCLDHEERTFWSLQVFGGLKIKTVLPALSRFFTSPNKDFRLYAVRTAAQISGDEALKILIEGFCNDLWVVRQECFRELSRMQGVRVVQYALRYLNHENDSIHYWARKLVDESRWAGASSLALELEGKSYSEVIRLVLRMEDLQEKYVEELFKNPGANLLSLQNLLQDPWKLREGKAIPGAAPRTEVLSGGIGAGAPNYFHFPVENHQVYEMSLEDILEKMIHLGASDLHLKVGQPPMVRVNGEIQPMNGEILLANQIRELLRNSISEPMQRRFCEFKQVDCSYTTKKNSRFRVNIYLSHTGIEAAFRHIRPKIPTFAELGLPEDVFERFTLLESGLVLITGVTGAGKSSTLASIIGAINRREHKHIICIEDPIEYVHSSVKSVVSHRQLGEHVDSFVDGLKACMREDPDVVLVGEMRDAETIKSVLKLAGTGHLVFSTFHTSSAPQTLEQLIQYFPPEEKQNICAQLSFCLKAVVSQNLVHDVRSLGRVPVLEVMVANQAVRNLIRDGKTEQLTSVMQTSSADGMFTRDQYLKSIYQKGKISRETYEYYLKERA